MKYSCIVVDDEVDAVECLTEYIAAIPDLEILNSYNDPLLALNRISSGPNVDIIFLDVEMPTINGLELAKAIRHKTNKLVFNTAHSKYAYDAFETHADAFLLKPYSLGKFAVTINGLLTHFPNHEEKKQSIDDHAQSNYFFVKTKQINGDASTSSTFIKITFDDIIYVESILNHVSIYTLSEHFTTFNTLKNVGITLLASEQFIQPHRSFIINRSHIKSVDHNNIVMENETKINIGHSYREGMRQFIDEKSLRK